VQFVGCFTEANEGNEDGDSGGGMFGRGMECVTDDDDPGDKYYETRNRPFTVSFGGAGEDLRFEIEREKYRFVLQFQRG
jgi:hypothetical protein